MNEEINILYELTFGFFLKMVDLADVLIDFLFYQFVVGNWTISLWQVAGGTLITVLLISWLRKKIV